jgi:hypothetical protein
MLAISSFKRSQIKHDDDVCILLRCAFITSSYSNKRLRTPKLFSSTFFCARSIDCHHRMLNYFAFFRPILSITLATFQNQINASGCLQEKHKIVNFLGLLTTSTTSSTVCQRVVNRDALYLQSLVHQQLLLQLSLISVPDPPY